MRSDRLGLWMIAGTLMAALVVVALMVQRQAQTHEDLLRSQGVGLTRLIAGVPFEYVVPGPGRQGVLAAVLNGQAAHGLGYGLVVDRQGRPVTELAAPGVIVPGGSFVPAGDEWFGERRLDAPGNGRRVREFYGPVLGDGEIKGYVRLGYLESGLIPDASQVPFIGMLALPVFLLTPLFYLLVRRETRPLHELGEQLSRLAPGTPGASLRLEAEGDLREFVQRFNEYVRAAERRMRELEETSIANLASTKVVGYRRERMDAVLHTLPDGIAVLDEAGTVVMANGKLEPLVGSSSGEMTGRPAAEWCHNPELLAFVTRAREQVSRSHRAAGLEFTPPDAPERRVAVNLLPLALPRDPEHLFGAVLLAHDITGEHLAKRAREEFVSHVSHELKTPLSAILMYAELLQDELSSAEPTHVEAVNVIHDEAERMRELIGNLLSISRIEAGSIALDRQRVRLHELLRDAVGRLAQSRQAAGMKLEFSIPQELTPVAVDKQLLRIAVENLLTNAIKYNRPGGTVSLSAHEDELHVVLGVRDTGIGISPEHLERVFDKFYRAEDPEVHRRSGHGLGLYLTRQIVELHHGRLEVSSIPGEGSEFRMVFDKTPVLLQEGI